MSSNFRVITAILLTAFLFFSAATFFRGENDPALEDNKINLALRLIAHKLMRHSGDSLSAIAAVVQQGTTFTVDLGNNNIIRTFETDTLVKIVQQVFASKGIRDHYLLNMLDCTSTRKIVFGFEYIPGGNEEIACSQRKQSAACYRLQLVFPDRGKESMPSMFAVSAMIISGFALILFTVRKKKEQEMPKTGERAARISPVAESNLGIFHYDAGKRILQHQGDIIALSEKENRLLAIFVRHLDEVVDRDLLMKEVWEDDGVFVGRSLDVFVSRLRKKIGKDPSLSIVNIHGKGYKLMRNHDADTL